MKLRIPGPTECPDEVLKALSKQAINHRSPEFRKLIKGITEKLKQVFFTKDDVLLFTSSGTGGLEAAITNFLSPGDCVLSTSSGAFGDRFADIAEAFGARVIRLTKPPGQAIRMSELNFAFSSFKDIKAVLLTHNETSTGVTNSIGQLAYSASLRDKLIIVDAVSSLSVLPLFIDNWKLDVVVTASQKGWMAPPGISMMSVSEKAWEAHMQAKMPRFYFDISKAKQHLEKGETPWTPALSTLFGLEVSLELILKEGIFHVFKRHMEVGEYFRKGLKKLNLEILPSYEDASNSITAIKAPEFLDGITLKKILRENYGIEVGGGHGKLAGKIIRVGHMGLVQKSDMDEVLDVLKDILK